MVQLGILFLLFNVINIISSDNVFNFKPPKDHAKVARQLVHDANWAATGTISSLDSLHGFPMVNIISIADSATHAPSTGNIYFLLTMKDFTAQDVKHKNVMTMLISKDENLSCENNKTDPMEPTCGRVIISGKVIEMQNGTEEFAFGMNAFRNRHPSADQWLKAHHFFLCKLDIENIFVLDWYGGPHTITPDQYYNAVPDGDYINYRTNSLENSINEDVDYIKDDQIQTENDEWIQSLKEEKYRVIHVRH